MASKMITLTVTDGIAFVWNADDWLKLREDHRIVGALIGCLAHLPRQNTFPGLPLALLPEEATLLAERKVAHLVRFPSLSRAPGSGVREEFEKYTKSIYENQVECFMQERKRQVINMIDQIAEGKKRKLMGLGTRKKESRSSRRSSSTETDGSSAASQSNVIDKEALLREELEKITPIDVNNSLVQTFTAYPWLRREDACPVKWNFPSSPSETIRYRTFKDLWEKGYYLTSGQKFGGDFLAYPGDPVKFHAQFLVVCKSNSIPIRATELVALGRLATSVRKTVVLATSSVIENKLLYQSLRWNETI